eukprot:NODE_39_length_35218_cov_0.479655.p7 type:complete len:370 gc:universal NODE_39_length_35218_cov_0.479655:11448-12557(+)
MSKRVIDIDEELNNLGNKIGNLRIQQGGLYDLENIRHCLIHGHSISEALVELRKYLCTCNTNAIDTILNLNILEILWKYARSNIQTDVYEITWIFTNLSAGNEIQTSQLVQNGIIELMAELLASPSEDVIVQALWCLGNISGDHRDYRERILACLAPYHGMSYFVSRTSLQSEFPVKVFSWVLSNLCRLKPNSDYWNLVVNDLSFCVYNLDLFNSNDDQTIIDFCWALTRCLHSVSMVYRRQLVTIELVDGLFGIVKRFKFPNVLVPVFRVLTNIVAGDDTETKMVIQNNYLSQILKFLETENASLLKECLMCLSNIAASNSHGESLHDTDILLKILQLLSSEFTSDPIKMECLWILSNCISMKEEILQ